MATTAMEHSRFLIHGNSDKTVPKHNKFPKQQRRLCHHISPNGSAGGVSQLMPSSGGISPFNLHYFRPYLFWHYLKKSNLTFPQQALKKFIMGNYTSTLLLKSHRGNTGSHRGKRSVVLYARIVNLCIFTVISLFWSMA